MTHEKIRSIFFSVSILFLVGCVSPQRTEVQPADDQIDIYFAEKETPEKKYRVLGTLTDEGSLVERDEIETKMLKQARKKGADAIIFDSPIRTGQEAEWFEVRAIYMYRALFVKYTP